MLLSFRFWKFNSRLFISRFHGYNLIKIEHLSSYIYRFMKVLKILKWSHKCHNVVRSNSTIYTVSFFHYKAFLRFTFFYYYYWSINYKVRSGKAFLVERKSWIVLRWTERDLCPISSLSCFSSSTCINTCIVY